MTTYANPSVGKNVRTSEDAGQLTLNLFVFDLAATAYQPPALAQNDLIQIGLVPLGEKLVPHLCRIDVPQLDSNGAPTGDYAIGTLADDDALKGSAASETAVTLFGEDFALATAAVGSASDDTPIYLKAVNASATLPVVGKIVFFAVSRPVRADLDG